MVVGTALEWPALRTVALAVVLAFVFGYALTSVPLLRSGMPLGALVPIALAADTGSIIVMETVDNAIMVVIPGAMNAGADHAMFWGSLGAALLIAGAVAYPVNRWLLTRGKGHTPWSTRTTGTESPPQCADRAAVLPAAASPRRQTKNHLQEDSPAEVHPSRRDVHGGCHRDDSYDRKRGRQ